jgi:hypothetical protein
MNCVAEQGTPKFGSPPPAPGITVVFPRSPPGYVDVKDERFAREFPVNQEFELLQTVAKAILENRHQTATAFLSQTGKRIHGGQTGNEWLFANYVFPGIQRPRYLLQMQVGWRTDIDQIDIWSIARFRKTAGGLWNPVFFRYGHSALEIKVANYFDVE